MTEYQLIGLWSKARLHVILSQIGPIFLLTLTIALLQTGLGQTPIAVRLAAAGILLATGVLGVVSQVSAANEAIAVADDLRTLATPDAISRAIVLQRQYVNVVRVGGPAIFVLVFLALLWAMFITPLIESFRF